MRVSGLVTQRMRAENSSLLALRLTQSRLEAIKQTQNWTTTRDQRSSLHCCQLCCAWRIIPTHNTSRVDVGKHQTHLSEYVSGLSSTRSSIIPLFSLASANEAQRSATNDAASIRFWARVFSLWRCLSVRMDAGMECVSVLWTNSQYGVIQ